MAWTAAGGATLAALVDTLNSTLLVVSRGNVMGTLQASPDEVAWINMAFLMGKLTFFLVGSWLTTVHGAKRTLFSSVAVLTMSSFIGAVAPNLEWAIVARLLQGAAGGVVLVAAQSTLLWMFASRQQGLVQATYALSVVLGTATLAPGVHGLLSEEVSWRAALALAGVVGLLSLALLFAARNIIPTHRQARPFDWLGATLFAAAMSSCAFLMVEGARFNWFEQVEIRNALIASVVLVGAFLLSQAGRAGRSLLDLRVFRSPDFTFGFIVSFVAGVALFGSGYIIPVFALQVLQFTPAWAGLLLMPSALSVLASLLIAGTLFQLKNLHPLSFLPVGILATASGMYLLSFTTPDSGFEDLVFPLVLRGAGLGFLFIGLTMETLLPLRGPLVAYGVGLFNVGRQFGGLIGLAFITTYLNHRSAEAQAELARNISPSDPSFAAQQDAVVAALTSQGYSVSQALEMFSMMVRQEFAQQVAALAFNDGLRAFAWLFPLAAPLLGLANYLNNRLRKKRSAPVDAHPT